VELTNEFRVAAPVEQAWPLLTDIERIAPCVPGFKLTGIEGDEYQGLMKVKVGAVQMGYDCVIRFVERDDEGHRAVIAAKGRETRGQGGVTASITSTLTADGDGTQVSVVTDLNVTGRVAQFGRNILAEVSDRLVKQFVRKLETQLLAPEPAASAASSSASAGDAAGPPGPRSGTPALVDDDDDALNLLSVAGGPLVRRAAPVALGALLIALVLGLVRTRGAR
jgi:carbon monoxide dehydrogenase subunit G